MIFYCLNKFISFTENVVFRYIVLLFDNSKSMTIKNKDNTAIKFAKQFIGKCRLKISLTKHVQS